MKYSSAFSDYSSRVCLLARITQVEMLSNNVHFILNGVLKQNYLHCHKSLCVITRDGAYIYMRPLDRIRVLKLLTRVLLKPLTFYIYVMLFSMFRKLLLLKAEVYGNTFISILE